MLIITTIQLCNLKHLPLPSHTCPLCGAQGGLVVDIWKQVVGTFGVPMMPGFRPKSAELTCNACGAAVPKSQWTPPLEVLIRQTRDEARVPNRYRFGLLYLLGGLAVLLGVGMVYGNLQRARRDQELRQESASRAHPRPGQILAYTVETVEPGRAVLSGFGFGRIERIEGDALWVRTYDHPLTQAEFATWMDRKVDPGRLSGPLVAFKLSRFTASGRLERLDAPAPAPGFPPPPAWGTASHIFNLK